MKHRLLIICLCMIGNFALAQIGGRFAVTGEPGAGLQVQSVQQSSESNDLVHLTVNLRWLASQSQPVVTMAGSFSVASQTAIVTDGAFKNRNIKLQFYAYYSTSKAVNLAGQHCLTVAFHNDPEGPLTAVNVTGVGSSWGWSTTTFRFGVNITFNRSDKPFAKVAVKSAGQRRELPLSPSGSPQRKEWDIPYSEDGEAYEIVINETGSNPENDEPVASGNYPAAGTDGTVGDHDHGDVEDPGPPMGPVVFNLDLQVQRTTGSPQVRLVVGSTALLDWQPVLALESDLEVSLSPWTSGTAYKWQFKRGSGAAQDIATGTITAPGAKNDSWTEEAQETVKVTLNLTGTNVQTGTKLKLTIGETVKETTLFAGASEVSWDIPIDDIPLNREYTWTGETTTGATKTIHTGTIADAVEGAIEDEEASGSYDGTPPGDPKLVPPDAAYPQTTFPIQGGENKVFPSAGVNQKLTFQGVQRVANAQAKGKATDGTSTPFGGATEVAPFSYKFKVEGLNGAMAKIPQFHRDLGNGVGPERVFPTDLAYSGNTVTLSIPNDTLPGYAVRGWSTGLGYGQANASEISTEQAAISYNLWVPAGTPPQNAHPYTFPERQNFNLSEPWWEGSLATGNRTDHYYSGGLGSNVSPVYGPDGPSGGFGQMNYTVKQMLTSIEFTWQDLSDPVLYIADPDGDDIGQVVMDDDTGVVSAFDVNEEQEDPENPGETPQGKTASGISNRGNAMSKDLDDAIDTDAFVGDSTGAIVDNLPDVSPSQAWPEIRLDLSVLWEGLPEMHVDFGDLRYRPWIVTFRRFFYMIVLATFLFLTLRTIRVAF